MKVLLIGLATAIAGLIIGMQFDHVPEHAINIVPTHAPTPCALPTCPTAVDTSDLAQQSLQEAAEVYGKAFQLFLLSLGLNLNQEQQQSLQKLLDSPQDFLELPASARVNIDQQDKPVKDEQTLFVDFQKVLRELRLSALDQESDFIIRGTKKILTDPGLFYLRAEYTNSMKAIGRLNGQYNGEIFHIAGAHKGKTDLLRLSVDYRQKSPDENAELEGNYSLVLSRDGEVYSDSKGSGGNGRIRLNQDQLIIEAGPNSFLHFTNHSLTEANFYIEHRFVGVAKLEKL